MQQFPAIKRIQNCVFSINIKRFLIRLKYAEKNLIFRLKAWFLSLKIFSKKFFIRDVQKEKVLLFPEIRWVIFFSLIRLHSRMCIGIYIFLVSTKNKKTKKVKETKKEKIIFVENLNGIQLYRLQICTVYF